jgi:SAM-dependent methyltransferase
VLESLRRRLEYHRYRRAQIRQSRAKRHKDASFRIEPFVGLIVERCPDLQLDARILCIGARNEVEIQLFERRGFSRITAVDLWSSSPRIRRMDMHALDFPDASFDLVFASHVFEHAFDFDRVARECVRVLADPGYIFCAMPVDFELSAHDRVDVGNLDGLLAHFARWRVEVLFDRLQSGELSALLRVRKA